jgi:LCP family protein required for cell wall assembly
MNTRKKMKLWKKLLIVIAALLFALIVSAGLYACSKLNKINRPDSSAELSEPGSDVLEFETDADAGEDTMKPEDVEWAPTTEIPETDKDIINVLLIGQDRREGQGRQRSDSMIVATINKKNDTITLTSILRDTYVQIDGYNDNRVNAAYAFGGMNLLDKTIEKNFGIQIDANIEVDFEGFKQVIDRIGGIDITLKDYEAEYFNEIDGSDKYKAGLNHMDGSAALRYSRTRYVGRSDFERTERQRTVMLAAFSKMKNVSLTEIPGLVDELFPCLTTDLSNMDILSYAMTAVGMRGSEVKTFRIPADGSYSNQTIRGMMVLVPDLDACRRDFKAVLEQ